MSETRHQFSSLVKIQPFQPRREEFHIIEAQGKAIAMVPLDRLNTIRNNDRAWQILATGIALGATAIGASLLVPALTPPEPVIVREQAPPVVIDRNCIAFCSK